MLISMPNNGLRSLQLGEGPQPVPPPSMPTRWPVTYDAASDTNQRTTAATSSGWTS
jgi:hypothetical protein